MLDEQGQQLDRVEGNLNTINAEMKQAEKTLSKMEKWCGLFTCPWNRYLSSLSDTDNVLYTQKKLAVKALLITCTCPCLNMLLHLHALTCFDLFCKLISSQDLVLGLSFCFI